MSDRPTYETNADLEREKQIGEALAHRWQCRLVKLPKSYHLDWAAARGDNIVAWIEAKRRFRTLKQFDDVFLSMQKVMAAYQLHGVTGKRCLYVVRFDDCLAYADIIDPPHRRVLFKGRTDRDDWQDQEAVIAIPVEQWSLIDKIAEAA